MVSVVICAGGVASRMRPYSKEVPKTLFELEPGVTILDHIMERVRSLNPEKVVVVTRPTFRGLLEGRLGGDVKVLETDEEDFGNLYTVYLALDLVDDPFLIVMSDHVFEVSMLKDLASHESDKAFTVCLDRNPSRSEAIEGLKLAIRGEGVVLADKTIPPHHGIDTGLIMCRGRARDYIRDALMEKGPKAKISDALNVAASSNDIDYVDVTGKLWKDVDTPEDLERARKLYWEILRRELVKPEDGLIARYLNRPISTRISLTLYRRGVEVNPNIVSLFSLILCFISAFTLTRGYLLVGGILAQVASVLDGVDGEIARLFRRSSKLGSFLDSLMDRISDVVLISGIALSLWSLEGAAVLLPILASANSILVSYATSSLARMGVDVSVLRLIPATRDARIFVIFLACALSQPQLSLWYISTVPLLYVAGSLYLAFRDLREPKEVRRVRRGKPLPELPSSRGEAGFLIREILSNSFKMGVCLLLVRMFSPLISDIAIVLQEGIRIGGDLLLTLLDFLILIYFGYRILMPIKRLFDMASDKFAERVSVTRTTLGRIMTDLLYLVTGSILWIYLPSIVRPVLGDWVSKLIYLGIAILLLISAYDIVRTLYRTFEDLYSKLVDKLAGKISGDV